MVLQIATHFTYSYLIYMNIYIAIISKLMQLHYNNIKLVIIIEYYYLL
jgi:hypothetical protein